MPLDFAITRVAVRDYKSIAAADVELGPLTFLVGPNGSGKSNFLDALRFVADCLNQSVEHALRRRGGFGLVHRLAAAKSKRFSIRIECRTGGGLKGYFEFEIAAKRGVTFAVTRECCAFGYEFGGSNHVEYQAKNGTLLPGYQLGFDNGLPPTSDLWLSSLARFSPNLYDLHRALKAMRFYRLQDATMRELQNPDVGELLSSDGSNTAAILDMLGQRNSGAKQRIEEYLAAVDHSGHHLAVRRYGSKQTIEFRGPDRVRLQAESMSDGTLRALGILLALFQSPKQTRDLTLICIEEPETALHPAAAGVLLDALREASGKRQVLVTSHSPDLLDTVNIEKECLLAVSATAGVTHIGALGKAGRSVLNRRLKTPGDLLRSDQMKPEVA